MLHNSTVFAIVVFLASAAGVAASMKVLDILEGQDQGALDILERQNQEVPDILGQQAEVD